MKTYRIQSVVVLCLTIVLGINACATSKPLLDPEALPALTDVSAEQWQAATQPPDGNALLTLTPRMREFVDINVTERRDQDLRIRQLTRAVLHPGSLGIDYDDAYTGTAAEVFDRARGNCLSLSILFVALARYADIDANFFEVDVVPNWTRSENIIFATRHVNVGGKVTANADFVMDFSPYVVRREIRRRKMSDNEALAQYYNNLGAHFLADGDLHSAWLHFSKGIALAPRVSFLWSNMAVVYSRNGQRSAARLALQSSIALNPDNTSALANLALMYEADGDSVQAQQLRQRISNLQQDNPYFQFALAEKLLASGQFSKALDHLHVAIRLRDDEPLFFDSAAEAAEALGNAALAKNYTARASRLAKAQRARQLRSLNL